MWAENADTEELIMEKLAGNPLHAFHLMKRLTVDWRHFEKQARADDHWRGMEEQTQWSKTQ